MKYLFLIGLFLSGGVLSKDANSMLTTEAMLKACKTESVGWASGYCKGAITTYVSMAIQSGYYMSVSVDLEEKLSDKQLKQEGLRLGQGLWGCVLNKSNKQLIAVFIKYAENNPESWSEYYNNTFQQAFLTAWGYDGKC